ncbi:MAG: molybdenum cofactor guanylyltransferase [Halobacteriaceae archaeon]
MIDADREAVVLAGGRSTRFSGEDKAFADLAGRPLLGHVIDRLEAVLTRVVVSCRPAQSAGVADALAGTTMRTTIVEDRKPDRGPAAGLAEALGAVEASHAAVVACDNPLVDPTFIELLYDRIAAADGVVPRVDDRLRPVQAVYRSDPMRDACRTSVETGNASLHGVLDHLDMTVVTEDEWRPHTDPSTFLDVNTRDDLAVARAALTDG